jgi:hypothetical protein
MSPLTTSFPDLIIAPVPAEVTDKCFRLNNITAVTTEAQRTRRNARINVGQRYVASHFRSCLAGRFRTNIDSRMAPIHL